LNDQSIDPKVAALLLRVLRKELSDDQTGQDLLTQFERDPDAQAAALTDYLRARLEKDKVFEGKLAEARGIPGSMRAIIYGGKVERLVQVAQAGTLVINNQGIPLPIGLTAVVFGVIAVTILVISRIPRQTPAMSRDGFNVAVAEFALIDSNDNATASEISSQFSDGIFETIENESKQLSAAFDIETRGPADVGIVADDSQAGEIAARWEATVLIYGFVERDAQGFYQVEPRFYLRDTTFSYGSEVSGPNYIGKPITKLTLGANKKFEFNNKLNARVQALRSMFQGLAYFSINNYESAAAEFRNAINTPDWEQEEGQEVLYLLLGTAHLRAWDLLQNPDALPEASNAFHMAQEINPNYVRNYLGLGAVAIAQAQVPNEAGTGIGMAKKAELLEAVEWYTAALDQDQPPKAYIPTKAALGLGQVYLLGAEFKVLDDSSELAHEYFEQVVDQYQGKPVSDLAWFAAHAHAGLGRLAGLDADWETMSAEYFSAIDILKHMQTREPPPNDPLNLWIARFLSMAGFAEVKQDHLDVAQDHYEKAIELGSGLVSPAELKDWQDALAWIKEARQ